jgi:anti-repressor protein
MEKLAEITEMSTKMIAAITEKRHDHVLRDCDKLNEAYIKLAAPKIGEGYYTDINNQKRPMMLLSKMQTMDLMTGYSIELRIKVNRRWEELENNNQLKLPQTFSEALRALADANDREEQALLELSTAKETIEENKPKTVFADSVTASKSSILVRQFAKDLCDAGFEIGQNRLFQWFRQKKYLNRDNEPYQQYVNQGLFEISTIVVATPSGTLPKKTTRILGKGQVYFANKIKQITTKL